MSDKEYKLRQFSNRSLYYSFPDGGYHDEISSVLRRVETDLNRLYGENQLLKQRLMERDDVEWLRNNTVWEVIPSSRRTYTKTSDDASNGGGKTVF